MCSKVSIVWKKERDIVYDCLSSIGTKQSLGRWRAIGIRQDLFHLLPPLKVVALPCPRDPNGALGGAEVEDIWGKTFGPAGFQHR